MLIWLCREPNWNQWLREACRGGHEATINWALEKGADKLYIGLYGACRGGHMPIIGRLIQKDMNILNHTILNIMFYVEEVTLQS